MITQESSKDGEIAHLQAKLLGDFLHQKLVGGQILPIPAELESMRAVVRWDVTQSIFRVVGNEAMKSVLPEKRNHFQVMILQALKHLDSEADHGQADAVCQAGGW